MTSWHETLTWQNHDHPSRAIDTQISYLPAEKMWMLSPRDLNVQSLKDPGLPKSSMLNHDLNPKIKVYLQIFSIP